MLSSKSETARVSHLLNRCCREQRPIHDEMHRQILIVYPHISNHIVLQAILCFASLSNPARARRRRTGMFSVQQTPEHHSQKQRTPVLYCGPAR